MKIAFVTRGALPRTGGIQAHQHTIARGLIDSGHRVRVWAARIDDSPYDRLNTLLGAQRFSAFEFEGVVTKPFPLTAGARAALLPSALSSLRGIDRIAGYATVRERTLPLVERVLGSGFRRALAGADVVHAMGGEPQAHAAHAAARALGIPFVVTPFAHPGFWGDDELNLRLYRSADAVVALLPGERTWLLEHGVAQERVHVIGVPAPEPPPGLPERRERDGGGPLVLSLGVKRRYKYKLLLEALPHLGDPSLVVAFVGPSTAEWEADLAMLGPETSRRVAEVPKVDDREKWQWLRSCDVFCLPSVSEIMPVSILEAWRMERPVVVASGRWTLDLVEDGRDGIVVEPRPEALAKALESVLGDPPRARSMGAAGRRKVEENYTAAVVSAAHGRLYESLVGAKG